MTDAIYAYLYGGGLFVGSPVFYFLLMAPFLCLFVVCIVRALRNKRSSHEIAANPK